MNINVKLPTFPDWSNLDSVEGGGSFWDTQELSNINETLIRTVANLKQVNRELTEYERRKTELELQYKHLYRSTVLSSTAKTETVKKHTAELACEDIEVELAFVDEVLRELTRISAGLRIDLDILKTLSYNIRQEMKI